MEADNATQELAVQVKVYWPFITFFASSVGCTSGRFQPNIYTKDPMVCMAIILSPDSRFQILTTVSLMKCKLSDSRYHIVVSFLSRPDLWEFNSCSSSLLGLRSFKLLITSVALLNRPGTSFSSARKDPIREIPDCNNSHWAPQLFVMSRTEPILKMQRPFWETPTNHPYSAPGGIL